MDYNNGTNNSQGNPNSQYPQYQQPYQPAPYQAEVEEPVSLLDWVGTLLLLNFVPCIGLIVCIVWAFSKDTKKSKANFCKAYLIFWLVGVIISIITMLFLWGTIAGIMSNMGGYGSYYY